MALARTKGEAAVEIPEWAKRATVRAACGGAEQFIEVKLNQYRLGAWWHNTHMALKCDAIGYNMHEEEHKKNIAALRMMIANATEPAEVHGPIIKDDCGAKCIMVGACLVNAAYLKLAESLVGVQEWDQNPRSDLQPIVGYCDDEPVAIIMPRRRDK